MTLAEAVLQWQSVSDVGSRPRTKKYHAEIASIIISNFRTNKSADQINQSDVLQFVGAIERYSATRFNAIVGALKKIFPAASILKRRRVTVKDRYTLNQLEFDRLLVECDKAVQSHVGLVVRFLAHTGLRIGAARQLRWTDVQDNGIKAPGSVQKNGKTCLVPFVKGTVEVLDMLRAVTGAGEFILPQKEIKRSLNSACRRAGLPHLSHHDFRHLFATRCIESGVDVPTTARWLGHQDGGALLSRVYFHLLDPHSRRMAAKVSI